MSKPMMIMLVGLPGSGKSTFAKELKSKYGEDLVICSSDEMRMRLFGKQEQNKNELVFRKLHEEIVGALRARQHVVYDATNVNRKQRMAFLKELDHKKIDCEKHCVIVATPYDVCLENNSKREQPVPMEVIKKMRMRWNVPCKQEGFDEIKVLYSSRRRPRAAAFLAAAFHFNQHNPHHSKTLLGHSLAVMRRAPKHLKTPALFHDNGKLETQTFDLDGVAHYYGHEHVGAYNYLFYCPYDIEGALIIELHMRMFAYVKSEKARKRDEDLFGEEVFKDIFLINRADLEGH